MSVIDKLMYAQDWHNDVDRRQRDFTGCRAFYPTQIPHGLVWSWTLASTVKGRRLATWAIGRRHLSVMRNIWSIFTLTDERNRFFDHSEIRTYLRQVFVNILTPIRGTLTVSYRTLQYSQPVRTECKVESNSSETIAIRVPACIGNKNMNFTVKGNPSWNIYLTQTVKKDEILIPECNFCPNSFFHRYNRYIECLLWRSNWNDKEQAHEKTDTVGKSARGTGRIGE